MAATLSSGTGESGAPGRPGAGGRPGAPRGTGRAGLIGRAAALIAVLTVLSRIAGFARTLVFGWSVGFNDLGGTYLTANTVPNIIFEIVAGGALASLVVPLLAGAVARDDRDSVSATTSALLTWTLCLLVPLALVVALAAGPIVGLLASDAPPADLALGTRMLRVFAPQLPLYGIGVVLTGVLQSYRRFAWPVLAPLLSSLTVMTAYLLFASVDTRGASAATVSRTGEYVLSVGTTLGVAVLTLSLLIPLRRLGLRLRPSFGFAGAAGTVRGLAVAGAVTVAAQQLMNALAINLANRHTPRDVVLFNLTQTLYLLPWAVLAVPVAISSFAALAESATIGDTRGYQRTLASSTRSVLLLSSLGAAVLVGTAAPVARVLSTVYTGHPDPALIAGGLIGFAPGLLGYGLFALHSRALYARGETRVAAAATVVGWGAVAVASIALSAVLAPQRRIVALTVANSLGMLLLGAVLLVVLARRTGRQALAGTGRAGLASLVAGAVAAFAGIAVRAPLPGTPGPGGALAQGMLSGVVVVAVYLGGCVLLDRHDTRPMLARLVRRFGTGTRGVREEAAG
ncbi:MAG TPA: lipid II flippase MurJ [Micromonosporaceae bacterium]